MPVPLCYKGMVKKMEDLNVGSLAIGQRGVGLCVFADGGSRSSSAAKESSEMPRQSCNFRQRDLTRALKGGEAAGQTANRVEIDKSGTIILILDSVADRPQPSSSEPNEWDEV
jgi:hypothetical protein